MLKEIQKNIYQLSMGMPETRVKSINQISVYIVKGEADERNLLIDTGINQESCLKPILAAYEELGISQEDTDVFLTHMHSDHSGLIGRLKNENNRVIIEEHEAELVKGMVDEAYWDLLYEKYKEEGLPMDHQEYRDSHPDGENYCEELPEISCIKEGDMLEYGGYRFKCILTPGHSPYHTCLYDEETKTMISGDVVLDDVIPILFIEPDFDDPLGAYLDSLDKLEKIDIQHFIPGHGDINYDVNARIEEIREHYEEKFKWINKQLAEHGCMNSWELADLLIQHDFKRSIDTVSAVSRWFFFLPVCACVRYMSANGMITCTVSGNGVRYYDILQEK